MKNEKECKIVQDLLPNYLENLTNEETNHFIEEHLKECNDCTSVLQKMKKEISSKDIENEKRRVNYIKKYSNKMKALKSILVAVVLIYLLIVGRRTIIMVSLSEKANNNQGKDNYYAKLYSYRGDLLTITESYNVGDDYLTTLTQFSNGAQTKKLIFYKNGNEKIWVSELEGQKYLLNTETTYGMKIIPITYVSDGLLANLQYAFIIGIDKTHCNGKECYVIKGDTFERYIDAETGLAVRSIEKSNNDVTEGIDTVVDYEYKYNVVNKSDIVRPDTSNCVVNE